MVARPWGTAATRSMLWDLTMQEQPPMRLTPTNTAKLGTIQEEPSTPSRPPGTASTRASLWSVCAQELFSELEPPASTSLQTLLTSRSSSPYLKESLHAPKGWMGGGSEGSCTRTVLDIPAPQFPKTTPSGLPPRTPMVVWCEAKPTRLEETLATLAPYFGGKAPTLLHCETPGRFTRWLFSQPRGAVEPWALLVVGWREAKRCAMAIGAARLGDASQLRPDAKRPPVPPLVGQPLGEVGLAIKEMIMLLESSQQEARIAAWARSTGSRMAGLDIRLASPKLVASADVLVGGIVSL